MKTLAGRLFASIAVATVAGMVVAHAQGRGGGAWTTAGGDAQRTSSVRADPKISVASLQKPGFQFLWKRKLDTKDQSLTQPILLPNIIAYKGFKALAFVGGSADNVYSIDYDLNRMFWEQHLATASTVAATAACPGGLTAITKATAAAPPVPGGRGRGAGGPGAAPPAPAPGAAPPAAGAAPAARGTAPAAPPQEGPIGPGPAGRGPGAPTPLQGGGTILPAGPGAAGVPGGTIGGVINVPAARGAAPPAAQGPGGRGQGGIAGGRGGGDNVFAISSGGMVHVMNPQIGTDQIPPVKFLPPNAKVVGSILVDNVLYAATTGSCGGAANGVWAVDLVSDDKPVTTWDAQGAPIAGAVAPTFGTDSTIYVATGGGGAPTSNAVMALEPKTLRLKGWFSPGATPFTAAPIVFQHGGRDVVVAANKDGRLYVLDSAAIGGPDHMTALAKSTPLSTAAGEITGLASWVDAAGTRWIAAATAGAVHADTKFPMANGAAAKGTIGAFTVVDQNGAPTLQPQWSSRDLAAPVTPVVVNGVVFAVASGDAGAATPAAQRAQRSTPAVLYALDAATGKDLWNSGNTITSSVRGVGPSAGDSQVYVVAADGTLYAFGMPADR